MTKTKKLIPTESLHLQYKRLNPALEAKVLLSDPEIRKKYEDSRIPPIAIKISNNEFKDFIVTLEDINYKNGSIIFSYKIQKRPENFEFDETRLQEYLKRIVLEIIEKNIK